MTPSAIGITLLTLFASAWFGRHALAVAPVRPSPNAVLVMGLCVALGLFCFVVGEILG